MVDILTIKHEIKGAVTMRIDSVNRVYEAYNAQIAASAKQKEKIVGKDEVDFSSEAKDFATIKKILSDVPEVREDKVQEIKERMANGTYNVTAKDVADKILSNFSI